MVDPSNMTDEELDKAIEDTSNQEEGTQPESETPVEESKDDTPVAEEAPAAAPEPEPEQEDSEERPPSRREQLRVQQLLKKYGPPPQQPQSAQQPEAMDYRQAIDADDQVIQALESDRQAYGQAVGNQARQQSHQEVQTVKWETLLHIDAPNIESKYPVLDPQSPEFHPALADAMTTRYFNMVGLDTATGLVQNPNVRWKDFVESEFELADEIATTKIAKSTRNIAQQAASTGLRPDGSQAKRLNLNQAPEQMSDEELDAVIAQSGLSPKKRK